MVEHFHSDFEIPLEVKQDLVYCQKSLTDYILAHQVSEARSTSAVRFFSREDSEPRMPRIEMNNLQ